MAHTLESINDTLIEFKAINKTVTEHTIAISHMSKGTEDMDSKIKLLFKKYDEMNSRMSEVEKHDSIQETKTNNYERFIWIVITTITSAVATYYGTKG